MDKLILMGIVGFVLIIGSMLIRLLNYILPEFLTYIVLLIFFIVIFFKNKRWML